ncbi:thermonuclease family protein [Nocardioides sp. zg-536]|uniref:Thermonuclease family protein n=1 Tax=Nocardioides faecalis TaxID=2803858 RepID=A0A938YBM5_9ACTN|nr:thermonuclease family protein [Nocardioides faecalis]MBM9461663.1 thermonuclease family protein [Nocardioides faecalis]MBS4754588.1 thermonuclease family protein [Nocardioides faecalis]QVI59931.1 thermonuclease family protein [Nocardioides faecalis]
MLRRTSLLLLALALSLTGAALVAPTAQAGAPSVARAGINCTDFSTQAAAQAYFLAHGGPSYDPEGLDREGDGIACESNPCPCSTSTTPGGSKPKSDKPKATPKPKPKAKKTYRDRVRVTRVVDGDTIEVRLSGGAVRKVRLLGIDTPEVHGTVECGGRSASSATKRLLPRGTTVTLTSDPTQQLKDRYGRLLRYVQKGGTDVGRLLVKRGWAEVYVYGGKPFQRARDYRGVQRWSKVRSKGIWGVC